MGSTYTSLLEPSPHASCLRALRFADDEVKFYQEKVYDACVAFNAGLTLPADAAKQRNCKKDTSPCHLIQYQSLSNKTTTGGDGLTGKSQQDRIDDGNDADDAINDKFAVPNKYTDYDGNALTTPLDYHGYDYGGRMYYSTSVKLTCCAPDENEYDTNADGSSASDADKAMQRMCPPPENNAQGTIRWGDSDVYITDEDGVSGQVTTIDATATAPKQVCFHNRTLASPVHLASIIDYTAGFADVYGGINNATTLVEYVESPDRIWDQDKSATSFYQVRATTLLRASLCTPLLTAPIFARSYALRNAPRRSSAARATASRRASPTCTRPTAAATPAPTRPPAPET